MSTQPGVPLRGIPAFTPSDTRLRGLWLHVARMIWLALVLCAFALLVASLPRLPVAFAHLATICYDRACASGFLTPDAVHILGRLGISLTTFSTLYGVIYLVIPLVVWVTLGLILVSRKSDDWMALLVSLFLILFQMSIPLLTLNSSGPNASGFAPGTHWWFVGFYAFCQALAFPVLALFPNGRLVPRWMLWPLIALTLLQFVSVTDVVPSNSLIAKIGFPLELALAICLAGSMIYRYARVASLLERQQMKWLAFFFAVDILLNWIGPVLLRGLLPQATGPGSLLGALMQLLWPITILGLPLSIAIAILRYRLYDIDILINRTLVYGTLSVSLALVYVVIVYGAQRLVGKLLGANTSTLAIVASTLLIAALFNPLRRRIQATVDRRFYRRKYDATKTLGAFSVALRNEVDLSDLRAHLVDVVEETMQPAHVSLWLREPSRVLTGARASPWPGGVG